MSTKRKQRFFPYMFHTLSWPACFFEVLSFTPQKKCAGTLGQETLRLKLALVGPALAGTFSRPLILQQNNLRIRYVSRGRRQVCCAILRLFHALFATQFCLVLRCSGGTTATAKPQERPQSRTSPPNDTRVRQSVWKCFLSPLGYAQLPRSVA